MNCEVLAWNVLNSSVLKPTYCGFFCLEINCTTACSALMLCCIVQIVPFTQLYPQFSEGFEDSGARQHRIFVTLVWHFSWLMTLSSPVNSRLRVPRTDFWLQAGPLRPAEVRFPQLCLSSLCGRGTAWGTLPLTDLGIRTQPSGSTVSISS